MVKEKRTVLHPWQKVITEEEYVAKIKEGSWGVGFFGPTEQYYEVDNDSSEYKQYLEAKAQRKLGIRKKQSAVKVKLRVRISELKEEVKKVRKEKYQKGKEIGYKRGLKDGKPKMDKEERAKKKIAKANALLAEAEKLRGDVPTQE